jgi:glutathione S-transferase
MLKLWGRTSSINVRKVLWTLQALDVPFERVDAGLSFGIVKTPEYVAKNPNAMIPLLEDGDFSLWESNVIVRYLCAKYAHGTLYPTSIEQQFDAERWMDWQQTTLNNASREAFYQWIRVKPELRNHTLIAKSVAETEPLLQMIDNQLSSGDYLAGDHLTMADIPIACEIHRWWGLPQPRPAWVNIERWYVQMLSHPASRGVLDLPLA